MLKKTIFLTFLLAIMASYSNAFDDYDLFQRTSSRNDKVVRLSFQNRPELKDLKALKYFPCLQELTIEDCPNVKDLSKSILLRKDSLRRLSLCRLSVVTIPFVAQLQNLEGLDLSGWHELKSIEPVIALPKLKTLHLTSCKSIADLTAVTKIKQLRKLGMCNVLDFERPTIHSLHFLEPLSAQLEYLDLRMSYSLTSLSPLHRFSRLRYLFLDACDNLKDRSSLKKLKSIEELSLGNVQYHMRNFDFLNDLPKLRKVDVYEKDKLKGFTPRCTLTIGSGYDFMPLHKW